MGKSSCTTPLEIYHGVPKGWSKSEILEQHIKLKGTYAIDGSEAGEPGAPSFLPDRYNWLQYRETLRRVGDGVKENDHGCIEIAIRYIELNYFGSYSGFIRARLARLLKNSILCTKQKARLNKHFQYLVAQKECFSEFKELKKLIMRINERGREHTHWINKRENQKGTKPEEKKNQN